MRRFRISKTFPTVAGLLVSLLAILTIPLAAQPATETHPFYDITKEVTLTGTVSTVLHKPEAGMTFGSHLLIETGSGKIDASLGRWGLAGKGSLSVTEGEQVELTGVMKTLNKAEVFIVRSVKVNGKVYTMRNQHGIEVSPQARERAAQKGETL
jgi:hypothetical protein